MAYGTHTTLTYPLGAFYMRYMRYTVCRLIKCETGTLRNHRAADVKGVMCKRVKTVRMFGPGNEILGVCISSEIERRWFVGYGRMVEPAT